MTVCTHSAAALEQLAHQISGATLHNFTGFLLAGGEKKKKKCCNSFSFTMSSKPDTSAWKQIPEGGCYGYKVTPRALPCVKLFPILLLVRRRNPHGWNLSEASILRLQSQAAISRSAETFCWEAPCRIPRAPLMFTTCFSDLSNSSRCSKKIDAPSSPSKGHRQIKQSHCDKNRQIAFLQSVCTRFDCCCLIPVPRCLLCFIFLGSGHGWSMI